MIIFNHLNEQILRKRIKRKNQGKINEQNQDQEQEKALAGISVT